jgi:hypothetical protein
MLQIENYHQIKFTIHSRYWRQIFEDKKPGMIRCGTTNSRCIGMSKKEEK